jgi:ribosomal protein S18 acetylase RimI-like enzyme
MTNIRLRPFTKADQPFVRALILDGLKSRFGVIDDSLNPDLTDIHAHYIESGETFLVAELNGQIVGCGALIREDGSDETARIVRVSVDVEHQGRGIGRQISAALVESARERGFSKILVETNEDWDSALRLYQSLGFQEDARLPSPEFGFIEVHMRLDL